MFTYEKSKQATKNTIQKKAPKKKMASTNLTGIPDTMKTQCENQSGFSFDDVRIHYNSDKPAQLQALAYTQGNQVYVAPGQEQHLGHELGHVVQQKHGLVRPTRQIDGNYINDNPTLESQASTLFQANTSSLPTQPTNDFDTSIPKDTVTYSTLAQPIQMLNDECKFETLGSDNKISCPRPGFDEVLVGANSTSNSYKDKKAYHHIIPFNKLANFWDHMVENNDYVGFKRIMKIVIKMFYHQINNERIANRSMKPVGLAASTSFYAPDGICIVTQEDLDTFIDNINEKTFTAYAHAPETDSEYKSIQSMSLLAEMFTWMPFNLVHGDSDRPNDPGNEFDQVAANITGHARLYRDLLILIESYITSAVTDDPAKLIDKISFILSVSAYNPIFETVSAKKDPSEKEASIDILELDLALWNNLHSELNAISKQLQEDLDNEKKLLPKKPLTRKEKLILTNSLSTKIKKWAKVELDTTKNSETLKKKKITAPSLGDLQHLMTLELLKAASLPGCQTNYLQEVQAAVAVSLPNTPYSVEYGSEEGNNCFFYALQRLGFSNDVEAMREDMNRLRANVPGYSPTGMITSDDITAFANANDIRIQLYTVQGTTLAPAGQPGTTGALYHIVHCGLHYMPMIPVEPTPSPVSQLH